MSLTVSLINEIDAGRVTQLIPPWIVGIMAAPDSVDVSPLQQPDVFLHSFFRHHPGRIRVVFVAVDAPKFDRLAVDQ